jgi:hypothetical protein
MQDGDSQMIDSSENYIFISYRKDDIDIIRKDIEHLYHLGYTVWFDEGIRSMDEWLPLLVEKIINCSFFMVFITDDTLKSEFVVQEILLATGKKKPILPVFYSQKAMQVVTDHRILNYLMNHQAVKRHKLTEKGFTDEMVKTLPMKTRQSSYWQDAEQIGLGNLPKLSDIKEGILSIDRDVQIERRKQVLAELIREKPKEITIENMFQLTSSVTDPSAGLLKKSTFKKFNATKPTNLLNHPLKINLLFISPFRSVSGLITRLEENWPPMIEGYRKLVKKSTETSLGNLHYYFESCWLAWGPSVSMGHKYWENRSKFVVLQASYGDESNSLPLIMKRERYHEFLKELDVPEGTSYSGKPVALGNVLIVASSKDTFFKDLLSEAGLDGIALYFPWKDEGFEDGNLEYFGRNGEEFYNTAYDWVMLELVTARYRNDKVLKTYDVPENLEPGRVLSFFEHTNLASMETVEFLRHCLARKTIHHILNCERVKGYRKEGYYRVAAALFPEDMYRTLNEEISSLKKEWADIVRKRLHIPHPKDWRDYWEVLSFANKLEQVIYEVL